MTYRRTPASSAADMERIAASRSTAYVLDGLPPPAPADQITASLPRSRTAISSTLSCSTSASITVAPVAATSATCWGLRTQAVTS